MKLISVKGREIDASAIMAKNENQIAIGNASMNARGDIVGPGGKVIKSRETVARDYHQNNAMAVKSISLKEITPDVFPTPHEAVAALEKKPKGRIIKND